MKRIVPWLAALLMTNVVTSARSQEIDLATSIANMCVIGDFHNKNLNELLDATGAKSASSVNSKPLVWELLLKNATDSSWSIEDKGNWDIRSEVVQGYGITKCQFRSNAPYEAVLEQLTAMPGVDIEDELIDQGILVAQANRTPHRVVWISVVGIESSGGVFTLGHLSY